MVYIRVSTDNGQTWSEMNPTGERLFCFKTPVFRFDIDEGSVIPNSSYEFTLNYSQENNELLESYQIILYSSSRTELSSSGTRYVSSEGASRFTWSYQSFENSSNYYIRATGITVHNMEIDTGFIAFSVYYEHPLVFSFLEAVNLPNRGGIQLKTNFVEVKGHVYDINTGEEIPTDDLRFRVMEDGGRALIIQPNYRLEYDSEIYYKDDFSIALVFEEMMPNIPLFKMTAKGKEEEYDDILYWRIGRNGVPDDHDTSQDEGSYYPDQSGWFELVDRQTWTNINGDSQTFRRIYSSNVKTGLDWGSLYEQEYTWGDLQTYLHGAEECNVQNTWGNVAAGSIKNYYYVVWIKRKKNLWSVEFELTERKETGAIDQGTKY